MVSKYIIGAIYEKDCKTPKMSHQYRLGRSGKMILLREGVPMWFQYEDEELDGGVLKTSNVERFEENDNGLWIYTMNTVYRLDTI
jgi:hypothetical protein